MNEQYDDLSDLKKYLANSIFSLVLEILPQVEETIRVQVPPVLYHKLSDFFRRVPALLTHFVTTNVEQIRFEYLCKIINFVILFCNQTLVIQK